MTTRPARARRMPHRLHPALLPRPHHHPPRTSTPGRTLARGHAPGRRRRHPPARRLPHRPRRSQVLHRDHGGHQGPGHGPPPHPRPRPRHRPQAHQRDRQLPADQHQQEPQREEHRPAPERRPRLLPHRRHHRRLPRPPRPVGTPHRRRHHRLVRRRQAPASSTSSTRSWRISPISGEPPGQPDHPRPE